jgi:hypothetical protein
LQHVVWAMPQFWQVLLLALVHMGTAGAASTTGVTQAPAPLHVSLPEHARHASPPEPQVLVERPPVQRPWASQQPLGHDCAVHAGMASSACSASLEFASALVASGSDASSARPVSSGAIEYVLESLLGVAASVAGWVSATEASPGISP